MGERERRPVGRVTGFIAAERERAYTGGGMRRIRSRFGRRPFLRGCVASSGLALLAGCGMLPPQLRPSPPMRRIGILGDAPSRNWDALFEGLHELGWVRETNLAVEARWAGEDLTRYGALADELVRERVECIAAGPLSASLAAKAATTEIPVVAILVTGEALENGVVDNLARPSGNVTGMAGFSGAALQGKLLEILKETVPGASRIAVLFHLPHASRDYFIPAVESAATALRLEVQLFSIDGVGDLPRAFSEMGSGGAEALLIIPSPIFTQSNEAGTKQIAELAVAHRLPSINNSLQYPGLGGLLAYGVSRPETYRQAARYVDRILNGIRPGDLPMERPRMFDLVINLRTAQSLGLAVPQAVLAQATEVLQ
jgi:putative tryptophan/tyrosine transport system substrate-binding protein